MGGGKNGLELDLLQLRKNIDSLDDQILDLLNQRAAISVAVGRTKADSVETVFKPFREKEVLDRLIAHNAGPLPENHLRAIYREIMSSSRRLQRPERVVYLGPEGTFSYFAGLEYMGRSAELSPRATFEDIFRAVSDGEAELGVIPLENSLQGTVGQVVDLFMLFPVFIHAELFSRITHCLMGKAGTVAEVREIHSHPQPLDQCAHWLKNNMPGRVLVPEGSTAAAAAVAAQRGPEVATVGHVRLADRYGLNILAEHIEDAPDNWTRFLVIGPRPNTEASRDKTSILFTVPDKPGALAEVLDSFAGRAINITKLESRPLRGEKWKYVFFTDLECDLSRAEYESFLAELRQRCHTLKVLGSYPAGPHIETMG
ncbi:MAG TPA: chorismate mutase [Desulfovibrio sp.]|jgi:chorismate mutase/prephenate dehydratase|nr:chorismate mutase [Desulfovibrio sp.]